MSKSQKISGEVAFSYFIIALNLVLSPILIILLTRTLGVELYGVFMLLVALISLLSLLLQPGLSQYLVARLPELPKKKWSQVFHSILAFELLFLSSVLLVFYFTPLRSWFLEFNKLSGHSELFSLSLFITFTATLIVVYEFYFKAKQRINFSNFLGFMRGKGWVVFLLAFFAVYRSISLTDVLMIWLFSNLAVLFIFIWESRSDIALFIGDGGINFGAAKQGFLFGMPLILMSVMTWVIMTSDRYILNYLGSVELVGLYAVPYALFSLIFNLGNAPNNVLLPYFSESRVTNGKKYALYVSAALKYGLLVLVPGTVGAYLLGSELITLLSGKAFLASVPLVASLMVFPLFALIGAIGTNVLMINGRTKFIGLAYTFGALLNIAFNLFLIPLYGMHGAAIATVISYFVIAVLVFYPSRTLVRFDYKYMKIPHILVSAGIMALSIAFIHPVNVVSKLLTILLGCAVFGASAYVIGVFNRKEKDLFKSIMSLPFNRKATKLK
ncbi:MAG: polysaccharide biosynthesis C-terminal domain-containing protein [archaeon]|jgi:O-antigen/teichoic acid export membrane protein|nr:polysaccharide biosynthesis C-terminal domain-containing protein [archaeon]